MNIIQASDLLKTENIYKATPDSTLKETVSKLTSTHDAVFVFEAEKFVGLINPYYTVFKSSFPPDTKLSHCLYKPPQITPTTSLWDIARLMIESKIYYLPVWTNHAFHGIVTSNRILQLLLSDDRLSAQLDLPKKQDLITINELDTLSHGYALMREKQVSRLPVVTKRGRIVGIVSRYDIQTALTEPQQKLRFLSRTGNKEKFRDQSIAGYVKKMVITEDATASTKRILKRIIDNHVGSVIIVDRNHHPIGMVSTHDILKAISLTRPQPSINLQISTDGYFMYQAQFANITDRFGKKIAKRYPYTTIHLKIKTEKNPAGIIKHYQVTGQVSFTTKRKTIVASVSDFDWKKAVHEVLAKLEKQIVKPS